MKKRRSNRLPPTSYSKRLRSNSNLQSSSFKGSSSRSYHCSGCNKDFFNFSNVSEFLNNHMKVTSKCSKAIITCEKCNKEFIDEKGFMSHLSRSNKDCLNYHNQRAINNAKIESYSISEIHIPHFEPSSPETSLIQNSTSQSRFLSSSVRKLSIKNMKKRSNNKALSLNNNIEIESTTSYVDCKKKSSIAEHVNDNMDVSTTSRRNKMTIDQSTDEKNNNLDSNSFFDEEDNTAEELNMDTLKCIEIDNNADDDSSSDEDNNQSRNEHSENNLNHATSLSRPRQTHIHIEDCNHFIDMHEKQLKDLSSIDSDTQYLSSLELIQLCMQKNISLSSYKDFMKWKFKDCPGGYYSLDGLFKAAEKRVYGESLAFKMKPKDKNILCPSGRRVNIVTFDIDAAIYDLLSDSNLTQPENMIFDKESENPFVVKNKAFYTDLDQSGIYQETLKKYSVDPEREVLIPLIIYMDETNLDSYSKLVLHPIVLTLGIYNRKTRHLAMAWRTIGYLPNFDESFGNRGYSANDKASDFHYCLRYILDGLETIQQSNDMYNWVFRFPGNKVKKYSRKLIFFLSHVVSDAKENDMICGRMNNRSSTLCLCRDCDIKVADSDNPNIKCNFLKMSDLESYSEDQLQQLSFKKVNPYLAFSKINMGANIYGINGCTPSEPLHQINGGICERLPVTFLMRLSGIQVKILDSHVAFLCTYFSRQSDRSIYDIKPFRNGISKVSKLSGTEKVSRVLAIFLVLLTSDFEEQIIGQPGRRSEDNRSSEKITKEEYNRWVNVFEDTLILTSWVYHTNHPKAVFKGGRKSLAAEALVKFVKSFKKVAHRKEGMGDKYLKFHQILHLWFITRKFASLSNIDSGRNESHHKKKKEIGTHTQRRIELFDCQTARKEYTYDLMIKAMRKASMKIPDKFEMVGNNNTSNTTTKTTDDIISTGSKFKLVFDYVNKCIVPTWLSRTGKTECTYKGYILNAIFEKFKGYNDGKAGRRIKSIVAFTELKITDNNDSFIVRACPDYRSQTEWFDWVVVDWGEDGDGEVEAQVLMFLDFSLIDLEPCTVSDERDDINLEHRELKDKQVAIIHSCRSTPNMIKRRPCKAQLTNGYISNKLCHFRDMEETYQHVSVSTIVRPCAVYVDESEDGFSLSSPGVATRVFVLATKGLWHLNFINYNDKELLEEADKRKDDEYPMSSERYAFEG